MTEFTSQSKPQINWGEKVSSDLTIPSSLLDNVYDLLPVGLHDLVVAMEDGVLRTVDKDVFQVSHGPLRFGGIASNSAGDLILVQQDGAVTVFDRTGRRSGFVLPGCPAPNPLDSSSAQEVRQGGVFVASDTLGEKIAICSESQIQVFSRDGKLLAEHIVGKHVRAIAVKGDSILVARLIESSQGALSDIEISLHTSKGGEVARCQVFTHGDCFEGPLEDSEARGIVFSGDASLLTAVVPIFIDEGSVPRTKVIVVPFRLTDSQLSLEEPNVVILNGDDWMPVIRVASSFDGKNIAVVGYSDGDHCLYTIQNSDAGGGYNQVGDAYANATPFVVLTNSNNQAFLGPLDRETWWISGNLPRY